ncbi:hypothetical protein ASPVEDRAFT_145195 [Aspergillus versicolor CBS 583.65]|uniref:amidase n=1 Tax=Aspergillus versicolor CBS 583.65 TaxID=1036611 RepID=A0A1L9Q4U7_ASPVE|nr:uncharacterized protein ASPVEDRAFT_145195 [Aspergillus versicolor CBS 583.65]OJJ08759.1 hypothetical protein ASPVEDRAFT_145195 [Aspergillus versicolor CBS 583.65]
MALDSWEKKAEAKRAQAAAKIPQDWQLPASILEAASQDSNQSVLAVPRTCGLLTDRELDITEAYDATALVEQLARREFTSQEVTTAFAKRAAIAQKLTSCLTETLFEEALERARQLDEHIEKTGQVVGPLHGLPISMKDSFSFIGVQSTIGFVDFLDHEPKDYNSTLVDVLLGLGAVLFVKTNIPQTMMTADSHNNVFGRALNPHRLNLTPGGSSGGEGALISMRGSVMGVGTDVAGSVRIPALCCGIVGFKPTADRIPYSGLTSAERPGFMGIASCAGPLCTSVRDAELFARAVFNSNAADLDETALDIPWIEPGGPKKNQLTIGIIPESSAYPLHPPMQRTLKRAIRKLVAAGHKIIDLSGKLPSISNACDVSYRFFNMDPDQTFLSHVKRSGEPFIPSLKFSFDLEGQQPEPQLRELYELNARRQTIAANMHRVFVDNQLDLILGPGHQSCAVPHDTYGPAPYTVLWNLLNYPSCVLPFGKANPAVDAEFVRDVKYRPEYIPEEVSGAPCHIQLAARPFKDENLLGFAAIVEQALEN